MKYGEFYTFFIIPKVFTIKHQVWYIACIRDPCAQTFPECLPTVSLASNDLL